MNLPNCKTPCKKCPFRKDSIKGWLGSDRMSEILHSDSFACHETVDTDKDAADDNNRLQCAGFMLIKGDESTFVQLAGRFKIDTGLRGRDLVFDTKSDCIEHHRF